MAVKCKSSRNKPLTEVQPYYYAVIPVLLSSRIGDGKLFDRSSALGQSNVGTEYRIGGPVISFNALCLIVGFAMLGFTSQVTVRYVGVYLATGAYISNWAALNAYQANNIVG